MALFLKNKVELNTYLRAQSQVIEKSMIYRLEYLVAQLVNHAKLSAGYEDQTSNLKSSIGGVLLKDRKPITYTGFVNQGNATDGENKGVDFMSKVSQSQPNGYVIVLVAGMEYATYVEDYHNKNVLKKSELKMMAELPSIINKLKLMI
jgi:hypothetical protein